MGQQQLLLLALTVVVVGIAIVAGTSAFLEIRSKSGQDAAVSEAMRIASVIQAWKMTPAALGGGGGQVGANFTGISLQVIGYEPTVPGGPYITATGCFVLEGTSTGAILDVYSESHDEGCRLETHLATVTITGNGPEDIHWGDP